MTPEQEAAVGGERPGRRGGGGAGRLFVLAVAGYVLYGVALAVTAHAGFPAHLQTGTHRPYLADKPLGEDGFYMLTVAWNWAAGRGFTYNGGRITTGVQPLSTAVFAGIGWVVRQLGGGRWLFLRAVLLFGVLSLLPFGHLVGRLAQRLGAGRAEAATLYRFGLAAAVFNVSLFRAFTYGLETGIYLVLVAALVLASLDGFPRDAPPSWRFALGFGLGAGIAWLARLDFGVILATYLGLRLLRRPRDGVRLVVIGLVSAAVVCPWLLWVHSAVGHWIPTSGLAEAAPMTPGNVAARSFIMVKALVEHLAPWAYTLERTTLSALALASLGAFWAWLRAGGVRLWPPDTPVRRALGTWLVAMVPLLVIYPATFEATYFYLRYSAPVTIVVLPALAAAAAERTRAKMRLLALGALPACFAAWMALTLHNGRVGNLHAVTAGFLRQEPYRSLVVGTFQSGVVGFFNPGVVNLDGKMNAEALHARRAGDLEGYLDRARIEVLVDWRDGIAALLDADYLERRWRPCAEQVDNGRTICLRRSAPGEERGRSVG